MTEPLLPMELEVLDVKGLYESGDDVYIKFYNNKYHVETRFHSLGGVDWYYHFSVPRYLAQKIVSLGYADWWFTVDESKR